MRLLGHVEGQEVLILVDSGSVGTFVSEQLAHKLQLSTISCPTAQFIAADGSPMACANRIPKLQWGVQGHLFVSDAGILPLKCYDMIVGEDWLEECSPMWVHWKKKVMKFTYLGKRITLFGVQNETSKCEAISARKLKGLIRRGAVFHCLEMKLLPLSANSQQQDMAVQSVQLSESSQVVPKIKQLLSQYTHLFQEPTTLPPQKNCDHHINLIPGAQPMSVRPYRYTPA